MSNLSVGRMGEGLAADYLEKAGYQIIARNYVNYFGEIDLIAKKGRRLIFFEVKTKTSDLQGRPEEMVTPFKRHKLIQVARAYLQEYELRDIDWQIDVIAILRTGKGWEIDHIKNGVSDQ